MTLAHPRDVVNVRSEIYCVLSSVTLQCHYLMSFSSVTIWCHSLVLLSSVTIWRHSLVSLSGVTLYCHYLVSLSSFTYLPELVMHAPLSVLVDSSKCLVEKAPALLSQTAERL